MITLVIAEKPSVAQSIAIALGATQRKSGYLDGCGYLISWCVGHLVELAPADLYDARYAKWRREDLPILPDPWRFTVSENTRKQFDVLQSLLCRPDVDTVVNACDAGREGELIFRLVYDQSGCAKPVKRLWISSLEQSAILAGFQALHDGRDYDRLYQAALCRSKADWLVGINATRLFSLLYGQTLNVGRVMSPTLALLVSREAEIFAFVPETYYTVCLDCGFPAASQRLNDRTEAEKIAAICNGKAAIVKSLDCKNKTEKPPSLYDLTALQRDANRLLGYTAQQTLDYAQSLYEKKLLTYPRTDSRFLTGDMAASIPELASGVESALPFMTGLNLPIHASQVIDDAKVTDHHAIIPTRSMPHSDLSALIAGECAVLHMVCVRLLCALGDAHRYEDAVVTLECEEHSFTAKGKTILQMGWKIPQETFRGSLPGGFATEEARALPLPKLKHGQRLAPVATAVKEGKTAAKKHYTEDGLLAAMETAGAQEMPDDAERKGLGTPATRAGIIEKLVKTGFIERKGDKRTKHLIPTAKGTALITVLPEQLQSPLLTADWEQRLKEIERGEAEPNDFIDGIAAMLRELTETACRVPGAETLFPSDRERVGVCPRCGEAVTEGKKGFFCENRACRFVLWKDSRFFAAKKKTLTRAMAAALLKDGRVRLTGCFSENTGKNYDAVVLLDDTGDKYVNFKLEFPPKEGGKK